MPARSTLQRPTPNVSSRTVTADSLPDWARDELRVSPDSEITAFYIVKTSTTEKMKSRQKFLDAMDACQKEAAANGMTEAELDDILISRLT